MARAKHATANAWSVLLLSLAAIGPALQVWNYLSLGTDVLSGPYGRLVPAKHRFAPFGCMLRYAQADKKPLDIGGDACTGASQVGRLDANMSQVYIGTVASGNRICPAGQG